MTGYHKLLKRQLQKYGDEELAGKESFLRFIDAVNDSYLAFDRDKELSDHAFMISQEEFTVINDRLKNEVDLRKFSIKKLKRTLNNVKTDTELPGGSSDDLLEIVDILNAEISRRQEAEKLLIVAKEEAEMASNAKTDFLSIMSHEIRTPLNAVIGMGHLLLKNDPRPDQLKNLRVLKTSSDNLLVLINDILDFNKIEAGKLDLEHAPFSLKKLAGDIVSANTNNSNERENCISLELDERLPELFMGDALRIGQVLNNLVSNAVKFTHKGCIAVAIRVKALAAAAAVVELSVRDSGVGIAADKIASIFMPFTQASTSITRQYGGTGLGLAITKKILNLLHSDIEVESVPGEGSRFFFTLELELPEGGGGELCPDETLDFDLHQKRILLVEDTLFNVMYATQLLEGWNVVVDVAENGELAVEQVRGRAYDLVLMDLQMPVMDGYTATTRIREFDGHTPIIALTASATSNVREKVISAGMQDYVTKPFNPDDFYLKLKRYLG
jgi:signal transduction histidine kinase